MKSFRDILWILFLIQIQARAVQTCGAAEELSVQGSTCTIPTQDSFSSYGPRIEIDGVFHDVGSCDSDGNCSSVDDSRFVFTANIADDKRAVTLIVNEVYRNMTRFQCFLDGVARAGAECDLDVYVKGTPPVCEEPLFTDGGSTAILTCVSESIYPSGRCRYYFENTNVDGLVDPRVTDDNTPVGDNGEQRLVCQLHVTVTGSEAGTYPFLPAVIPDVPDVPDEAQVTADDTISLYLSPTALYNKNENGHVFSYPTNGELDIQIAVTGNPEPIRFTLSVAYEEEASFSPLPGDAYQATYEPSTDSSASGVIILVVAGGLDSTKQTFFTLLADNGVLGSDEFEYSFTVNKVDDEPEPEGGSSDNLLLIVGALVGGVCLLIFIAVMVIVLRRRCCGSDPNRNNDAPFDPPTIPGFVDPAMPVAFTVQDNRCSLPSKPPSYSATDFARAGQTYHGGINNGYDNAEPTTDYVGPSGYERASSVNDYADCRELGRDSQDLALGEYLAPVDVVGQDTNFTQRIN